MIVVAQTRPRIPAALNYFSEKISFGSQNYVLKPACEANGLKLIYRTRFPTNWIGAIFHRFLMNAKLRNYCMFDRALFETSDFAASSDFFR